MLPGGLCVIEGPHQTDTLLLLENRRSPGAGLFLSGTAPVLSEEAIAVMHTAGLPWALPYRYALPSRMHATDTLGSRCNSIN
jgi:hypothetical protein